MRNPTLNGGNVFEDGNIELLSRIITKLYESEDVPASIKSSLSIIGEFFDVSRVYIFEDCEDGSWCANTFEWCADGIEPQKNALSHMSYDEMGGRDVFISNYDEDGVFYCNNIEELCEQQQDVLRPQGIISMLHCALLDGGDFCGFIGFDECRDTRLWTKEQVDTLSLLSRTIGTFLLKQRHAELALLSSAIQSAPVSDVVGVYCIDTDGIIRYANSRFYELHGINENDMSRGTGANMHDFICFEDRNLFDDIIAAASESSDRRYSTDIRIIVDKGELCYLHTWGEIRTKYGKNFAFGCVINITEQKTREEKLIKSCEEYRVILRHSERQILKIDLLTGEVECYFDTPGLFDTPTLDNKESFLDFPTKMIESGMISPDTTEDFIGMYSALKRGEPSGSSEIQIKMRDGTMRWFHIDYSLVAVDTAAPSFAVITFYDITARRELEDDGQTQNVRAVPSGILSDNSIHMEVNLSRGLIEREVGMGMQLRGGDTLEDFIEFGSANMTYSEDDPSFRSFFNRDRLINLYRAGIRDDRLEYRTAVFGNPYQWYGVSVRIFEAIDSGELKAVFIYKNIDSTRRENERLLRFAARDPLTGAFTRESAEKHIKEALTELADDDYAALFIIDVDNFNLINERLGYHAGDIILRRIASDASDIFRSGDIIGRIGGDEFIALLPRSASKELVTKRAAALVNALQFSIEGLTVTTSVGAAVTGIGERSYAKLFAEADAALFKAKRAGKNCYHITNAQSGESVTQTSPIVENFSVQFKTLLEYLDGGVLTAQVTDTIKVTYVSPSFRKSLKYSDDYIGKNGEKLFSLVHPDDLTKLESAIRDATNSGNVTDCTYRVVDKNKNHESEKPVWRHIRIARLPEIPGSPTQIIAVITDITDLKASESELIIAEERYRVAIKQTGVHIWEVDIPHRAFTNAVGQSRNQKPIQNVPEAIINEGVVHPDSHHEFRRMFADIFAGRESDVYMFRLLDGNGVYMWFKSGYGLISDADGKPVRAVGVSTAMTNVEADMLRFDCERCFCETASDMLIMTVAVNASANLVQFKHITDITDNSSDGIVTCDNFTAYLNSIINGGGSITDFNSRFGREALTEFFRAGHSRAFFEFERDTPDGSTRWTSMSVYLLRHPVTGDLHIFYYICDTHSRKLLELSLRETVKRDSVTLLYTEDSFRALTKQLIASGRSSYAVNAMTVIELGASDTAHNSDAASIGWIDRGRGKTLEEAAELNDVMLEVARTISFLTEGEVTIGRIAENKIAIFRLNAVSDMTQYAQIEQLRDYIVLTLRRMKAEDEVDLFFGYAMSLSTKSSYEEMIRQASMACSSASRWSGGQIAMYSDELKITPPVQSSDHRLSIIIADDDDSTRDLLKNMLSSRYDIHEASDGAEALAIMRENPSASLLLLDLSMPNVNGRTVMNEMKTDSSISDIPVIVVTAESDTDVIVDVLDMGATDIITKPFQPKLAEGRIRNAISRHEAVRVAEKNREYELRLLHQSNIIRISDFDTLTRLPSRTAFFRRVRELLDNNELDTRYMIIRFDIDRFKVFNDVLGTKAGDRLLSEIGCDCLETYKNDYLVSHLETDHFAIFLPHMESAADNFANHLERWLSVYPSNFNLSASIGIYSIDEPDIEVSLMCDRALLALKSVKNHYGTAKVAYYDVRLRSRLIEEHRLVSDMKEALESEQFEVWLQPQVNFDTGELVGAEALVRWHHPEFGMLTPGRFIPLFESNSSISALDEYVWEHSAAIMRGWLDREDEIGFVPVAVNISRLDLYNPHLSDYFLALTEKYRLPTSALRLEITESAYMSDPEQLITAATALRNAGFLIEIDDFGSGYSSLNTLKDVPVDILKLDMRFLNDSRDNNRGESILNSMVQMAKLLNLPVIAEGVESKAQADYLRAIGCPYMQGFYFSQPVPIKRFEEIMKRKRTGEIKI